MENDWSWKSHGKVMENYWSWKSHGIQWVMEKVMENPNLDKFIL